MKAKIIITVIFLSTLPLLQSFCGFYVATGDTKIFNQASEVIMVRDGKKNVITMANDFQGEAKDFAMVVPVPIVLKENDIKVVKKDIFKKLNKYSEPRLVEYHDENPCHPVMYKRMMMSAAPTANFDNVKKSTKEKNLGVTIEAKYTVGEYDILILSAKESTGLKTWLTQNKYTIPTKAEEVLDPYIKQNMKFFVVKVNMVEMKKLGRNELSPIQITFDSEKFMLPIRLGMANAKNFQDLIIYAFTKKGRIETTNYRTVKIPTNKNIPTFMKSKFQDFYKDLFTKQYNKHNKNGVFLEYAWDISSNNFQKCDPCSATPPSYAELKDAGVYFAKFKEIEAWQGSDYDTDLFFTRLHVRYDRENFPMDLMFQETPNKENFQGRYIMQHSINVDEKECDAAKGYWNKVLDRREEELETLASLTGWDVSQYNDYTDDLKEKLGYKTNKSKGILPFISGKNTPQTPITFIFILSLITIVLTMIYRKQIYKKMIEVKHFMF